MIHKHKKMEKDKKRKEKQEQRQKDTMIKNTSLNLLIYKLKMSTFLSFRDFNPTSNE